MRASARTEPSAGLASQTTPAPSATSATSGPAATARPWGGTTVPRPASATHAPVVSSASRAGRPAHRRGGLRRAPRRGVEHPHDPGLRRGDPHPPVADRQARRVAGHPDDQRSGRVRPGQEREPGRRDGESSGERRQPPPPPPRPPGRRGILRRTGGLGHERRAFADGRLRLDQHERRDQTVGLVARRHGRLDGRQETVRGLGRYRGEAGRHLRRGRVPCRAGHTCPGGAHRQPRADRLAQLRDMLELAGVLRPVELGVAHPPGRRLGVLPVAGPQLDRVAGHAQPPAATSSARYAGSVPHGFGSVPEVT